MNEILLEFHGYKREVNKAALETKAGIYCVYAGTYNPNSKTVDVQKLLYIGKASDINDRIGQDKHEHLKDFRSELELNQTLMYSRAFISDKDERTIAEAALIYHCQPPINDDGKDAFHHEDTKLILTGQHALIDSSFIVHENGSVTVIKH